MADVKVCDHCDQRIPMLRKVLTVQVSWGEFRTPSEAYSNGEFCSIECAEAWYKQEAARRAK